MKKGQRGDIGQCSHPIFIRLSCILNYFIPSFKLNIEKCGYLVYHNAALVGRLCELNSKLEHQQMLPLRAFENKATCGGETC